MRRLGEVVQLNYPKNTHVEHISSSVTMERKIKILAVRDLIKNPLTIDEFLIRPFVFRSRWLISGIDQDSSNWRNLYLGSSPEFRSPGIMRIAIYDPDGSCEFIGGQFEPTESDRIRMIQMAYRWKEQDHGDLEMKFTCSDLRLIA